MPDHPREPKEITRDKVLGGEALKPGYNWSREIPAHGHSAVDFEERVNFRRLHDYRLARARQALAGSQLGSVLCFDNNNIRYLTS
ncbi:MAG: aminopeptidase P family protein, partial [Deltaproteobacteria bacterium]